jgi:hypothetical protein
MLYIVGPEQLGSKLVWGWIDLIPNTCTVHTICDDLNGVVLVNLLAVVYANGESHSRACSRGLTGLEHTTHG